MVNIYLVQLEHLFSTFPDYFLFVCMFADIFGGYSCLMIKEQKRKKSQALCLPHSLCKLLDIFHDLCDIYPTMHIERAQTSMQSHNKDGKSVFKTNNQANCIYSL